MREPISGRRRVVAIVLAGGLLLAVGAWALAGRVFSPPADPFAFDPTATGTDVTVPSTPAEPAPMPSDPPAATPVGESAAVETAATGRVDVTSIPAGALVTIDGERAGLTPVTVSGLSLGTHVVQVARPGFTPVTERVELSAGAATRAVSAQLSRGAPSGPGTTGHGSLDVVSRPRGASVTIDGRRTGTTPLSVPVLTPGAHRVEVALSGYRTVRTDVVVRAGERTRLALSLEAGARGRSH